MSSESVLDDLFHGCALAAFVEQARRQGTWPDAEPTRRAAYDLYERALAKKNTLYSPDVRQQPTRHADSAGAPPEMDYQARQKALVQSLNDACRHARYAAEVAASSEDYARDERVFLGVLTIPHESVRRHIQQVQDQLASVVPGAFRVPSNAWHLTLKNVRTIAAPPNFTDEEARRVASVLEAVAAQHRAFEVRFQDVLCTPTSVAVAGYSDSGYGDLVQALDRGLTDIGVPDNKKYASDNVFFTNLTLLRLHGVASPAVLSSVLALSVPPFTMRVDEVCLVSANLAFMPALVRTWGRFKLKV